MLKIVGSLIREIDLNKKQTDSDFIKSLPSQAGKEFEIKKGLISYETKKFTSNNNNNNNNGGDGDGGGGRDLITGSFVTQNNNTPRAPTFNDIFNPLPEEYDVFQRSNQQNSDIDNLLEQRLNNLRGISDSTPQVQPEEVSFFANNASNFNISAQTSNFNPFRRTNPTSSGGWGLETTFLVHRLQQQSEEKKLKKKQLNK